MPGSTLVIVPCYNERENIASLIHDVLAQSPTLDVLVVDDQSPDGTTQIVELLLPQYHGRLHLLSRAGKGGRGSAVLEGFRYALAQGYSIICEMDADFSHKPSGIPLLLQAIQTYDIVVGSRYLPGSEIHEWSWKRRCLSWVANRYARWMLGIPLSDYTNGFRCYRRAPIEALNMQSIDAKGYVVLSEVASQLYCKGFTIGEIPIIFVNRRRGASNLSFTEIREAFLSLLRLRRLYGSRIRQRT